MHLAPLAPPVGTMAAYLPLAATLHLHADSVDQQVQIAT
jgi:hypothetical protein